MPTSPLPDLIQALKQALDGEVRTDLATRILYSTDASIYQIEPLGVAFPHSADELAAAVALAASYQVPVLARGAGSSLAGQAIGPALILDCSRYLHQLLDIDPSTQTATAGPGVVLNALNRAAAAHGLQFGPDPASAERATLGGSLANNASGAHSIVYGMAADHLISAEVVLADGSLATLEEVSLERAAYIAATSGLEAGLYRAALEIRAQHGESIRQGWTRTWRRASGYGLNYLLPWSPSAPPLWKSIGERGSPYPPVKPGCINLAPLLAGSEGTLAVIRRATVRLVPLPKYTVLGVLAYPSIAAACDAVPGLLELGPTAVELIPEILIRLARSVPAYAGQVRFMEQLRQDGRDPAALLVIEFSGENPGQLRAKVQALGEPGRLYMAESAAAQRQVWGVRKVGLGLLLSRPGDLKPVSFIEDLAVPVERLGEFVREIEHLLAAHGTSGDIYAHASAGCLHIRPLVNLKTPRGIADLRSIAAEAVNVTLHLGGSVSGEHGDGLARSEWLEAMFGKEIISAFRALKEAADPYGLLNPGKILDAPRMDTHLRFGDGYAARGWKTALDFSAQAGLVGAVEQCNGAGVCRKAEAVMCPSFQATQEEMHSTRGRANLLRAMLSGRFPDGDQAEKTVYQALDLCLACKGCKAECPSAVDLAKLKYEFLDHYYRRHPRKLRDYLFGYIGSVARLGSPLSPLAGRAMQSPAFSWLAERCMSLSRQRPFPRLARRSLYTELAHTRLASGAPLREKAIFLSDAFTTYFYPETGLAALQVLARAGVQAELLPVQGAGRTLISKGFLEAARRHAQALLRAVERIDPQHSLPVIGVEPSEIYTLRDEYLDLLPGDARVEGLAGRSYMIDEYLVRPGEGNERRIMRIASREGPGEGGIASQHTNLGGSGEKRVYLHGHCYQKAQPPAADGFPVGVAATVEMLEAAGYNVQVIDSGCCGMAGAFGYEAEHYQVSMRVAELKLLPAVRAAEPEAIVAASGVSCQAQIEDGAGRQALHPIRLL